MKNFFYDVNLVRYQLFQTNGSKSYNWLFIPGGPGADSSYLVSLIEHLKLPGNVWLIDLPGNGSNLGDKSTNFDTWIKIFPSMIKQFDNPILVGHSFGGMFPLLFPELENDLKGFIILNAAPSLWLEEAVTYSKHFNLPDLSKEMQAFTERPSQETFERALDACMPYYFPPASLDEGRKLLSEVPFQYLPAVWWQRKAVELEFTAKWIPQNVPTVIVNATFDCICPYTLFQKDKRFQRSNIEFFFIDDAGHIPWVENPQAIRAAFEGLIATMDRIESGAPAFAALYRGYVKPGKEREYVDFWKIVSEYFVRERGALGSTLHKAGDMWVAYSKWPSQEMRDASWPQNAEEANPIFPIHIHDAIKGLKLCLDAERQLPEISMSIIKETYR